MTQQRVVAWALAWVCIAPAALAASVADLKLAPGPYYVGVPVEIEVVAEGFDETPEPEVHVDSAAEPVELIGLRPDVSQSLQIVNGQVKERRSVVRFVFSYRLLPERPGQVAIGPFTVAQGARRAQTPMRRLSVTEVPLSSELQLRLELPRGVYPGQRVPIGIEWRFAARLQSRLNRYTLRSQLFERPDLFSFVDAPGAPGGSTLTLQTASGEVAIPARISREGPEVVVRARRDLIPRVAGVHELGRASVIIDEVVRYRRDLFGRSPAQLRKLRALDDERRLSVRELPAAGRPASFAGAVGRGFSFEVQADRSVVEVGEPIGLTLSLRGDGPLEGAGLPPLEAAGLPAADFRPPGGAPAGRVTEGTKTFQVAVRPLHERVAAIPALEYAYFDVDAERYRIVRSRPVALSVGPARLIGAADVIASAAPGGVAPPGAAPAVRLPVYHGANLAIVRDPSRLLILEQLGVPGWPVGLLHIAALLPLAGAVAWRRRAALDPEVAARLRQARQQRERLARAEQGRAREAADAIASALRALGAQGEALPEDANALIAELEAIRYAPTSDAQARLDPELYRRALACADELLRELG